MAKTIIEQLSELLDADGKAKLQAVLAANPKVAVDDRRMGELFGLYMGEGMDEPATTTAATSAATTHTPVVPNTTNAATTTTTAAAAPVTTSSNDFKTVLDALNGLKTSMETKLGNVITKDQIPELSKNLRTQTIRDAHLTFKIEAAHKAMFNEDLDLDKVGTFITEQGKLGIQYPDVEKAYTAMMAEKLTEMKIAKGIEDGVKQKTSGSTVPAQTTSSALSPAQQINAKAKKDQSEAGGTRLQSLIERAKQLENSRESSAVN